MKQGSVAYVAPRESIDRISLHTAQAIVQRIADSGEISNERLRDLLAMEIAKVRKNCDEVAATLTTMLHEETAWNFTLSDGLRVQVKFFGPVAEPHIRAFLAVFKSISDNYVPVQLSGTVNNPLPDGQKEKKD